MDLSYRKTFSMKVKKFPIYIKAEVEGLLNGCFNGTNQAYIRAPSFSSTDLGAALVEPHESGTKVFFSSSLDCLQAILALNNKRLRPFDEKSRVVFFNPETNKDCLVINNTGLGSAGEIICIKEFQDGIGFISFDHLNSEIIDVERFKSVEALCVRCGNEFVKLGIHDDANYVAANCRDCNIETSAGLFDKITTFPNENFIRLVQYEGSTRSFFDIEFCSMKQIYSSPKDFVAAIGPLEGWEWRKSVRNFNQKACDATFSSVERKYEDTKGLAINIKLCIPLTPFWSANNKDRIQSLSLVLVLTQKEETCKTIKDVMTFSIEDDKVAKVCSISAQVILDPTQAIEPNSSVRVIPYPQSNLYEESVAFYNKWASGEINNSWLTRMLDLSALEAYTVPVLDRGNLEHKVNKEAFDMILTNLNFRQKTAVENAMKHDISVLVGPPGSGKTLTSAAILILMKLKNPDQKAVGTGLNDTNCDVLTIILNKFMDKFFPKHKPFTILRVYSKKQEMYARSSPRKIELGQNVHVLHQVVDEKISNGNDSYMRRILQIIKNGKYQSLNQDDKDKWESAVTQLKFQTIRSSCYKIIVCSMGVLQSDFFVTKLREPRFDIEVMLADEVNCLKHTEFLPALNCVPARIVLSGDTKSLKRFLASAAVENTGNGLSTLDWILESQSKVPVAYLDENYRLAGTVLKLIDKMFFEEKPLKASLRRMKPIIEKALAPSRRNLVVYNYVGTENPEGSVYNPTELLVVKKICEKLLTETELKPSNVIVLSFYQSQVDKLKQELCHVNVNAVLVDSVQGKQRDIVILTFTRSGQPQFGLTQYLQRIYLAMSRARDALILVMDMQCFRKSENPDIIRLMTCIDEFAHVMPAMD